MTDVFTSKKVAKKENEIQPKGYKKPLYKELPMQERRPLASFLMRPHGVSFETREDEEQIILFLRKHFVTNIPWIFTSFVMF